MARKPISVERMVVQAFGAERLICLVKKQKNAQKIRNIRRQN
jgi:hypothetical protein